MSLRISRQFHRWVRDILRIILNAALAVSIAFALHSLLQGRSKSWNGDATGLQLPPHNIVAPPSKIQIVEPQEHPNENITIWQAMLQDPSLQNFVDVVGLGMRFANIARRLDNPNETLTIYAPINSAFEGTQRHPIDVESIPFYYLFFVVNHMGPSKVSYEDLKASTTVENFINHDVYYKNLQRISTKGKDGGIKFNHIANYVGRPLKAINGYVHHIDALLYLPDPASDLLRSDPDLQTFQGGLTATDVAVTVNDTNTHLTRTIFAPTNEAFKYLGAKANKFLFSPLGKPYLTALLQYHVVMNRTLFTDVYFKPDVNMGGKMNIKPGYTEQVKMNTSSEPVQLRTLLPQRNLTASIVSKHHRQTIQLNSEVVVSHPDLVTMDGVIHKIDRVLLPPPLAQKDDKGAEKARSSVGSFLAWFWPWSKHGSEIGVLELMDRLQPYLVDDD